MNPADNKTVTPAVRQILMNELGLTRESVREEMKAIVHDTVQRAISDLNLDQIVGKAVDRALRDRWGDGGTEDSARKALNIAIRDKAAQFAEQYLSFAIEAKGTNDGTESNKV